MPPLTPISPLAWFPAEQQDPWDTGLLGSEGGIPPPPTPPPPVTSLCPSIYLALLPL